MADPPANPSSREQSDGASDRESAPGTPRWVKIFAVVALVVVAVFIILLLTGHGPAQHGQMLHG